MAVHHLPWVLSLLLITAGVVHADESAARGRRALETRAFTPASWPLTAYENVWKYWGVEQKPGDYDSAFRDRYGFHPAPFANGRYPLGLREGKGYFGLGAGVAVDCMLCHGGSILGTSYIGLGNSAIDIQAFFEDFNRATTGVGKLPFQFGNVRGTSEAGAFAVFLFTFREPDLSLRVQRHDLGLRDDLCEDTPAWWLLKKKQTMYYTGTTAAHSVRSIMQFMLTPNNSRAVFEREEATFRDVQAFLRSMTPPKYPYPIEQPLARQGEALFGKHCATCHGTYGEKWTYPNKIVAMDRIGTDRTRFDGLSPALGELYNRSWFAQEKQGWFGSGYPVTEPRGYQAPPLDGVWATAPYLHNGSVPTLAHLLNSRTRPRIFTRSYRTDADAYDRDRVGWKVQVLERGASGEMPPYERRKIYDTTQPGRGNGGHTFGDVLSDAERRAVIEYLKTL